MLPVQVIDPQIVDHDTSTMLLLQVIDPPIVEHDTEYRATCTGDWSTNGRREHRVPCYFYRRLIHK